MLVRRAAILAVILLASRAPAAEQADARLVSVFRAGMRSIISGMQSPAASLPSREERQEARAAWSSFLDYQIALETIRSRSAASMTWTESPKAGHFHLAHGAWLAQYRHALDFIARVERHPELHAVLDEYEPALGLQKGSYSAFKLHWLHASRAAEFAAFGLLQRLAAGKPLPGAADDGRAILAAGIGHGTAETARNAARIAGGVFWKPMPEALEAVAGGAASTAPRPSYVSKAQVSALRPSVQPGDILFERRDWALTNVGLPGFWSHVSLYVGTPQERTAIFGPALERELRSHDPEKYRRLARGTVVESVGSGTVVTTFERSGDADYFAVLRPCVPADAKATAIRRALQYVGRPYDFEFDFATDDRIVCSELLFKAYEGALRLPLTRWAGRTVTPPNEFVRWFDEHYGSGQLEFVAFLDGHAHSRTATVEDVAALRKSWKRPRWHAVAHAH